MPAATRGYDVGKKVPGRKRHVVTDSLGLLLAVAVAAANVGDRAAAVPLLERVRAAHRSLCLIWAGAAATRACSSTGPGRNSTAPWRSPSAVTIVDDVRVLGGGGNRRRVRGVALPVPPVGIARPGLAVGPAPGPVEAVIAHQQPRPPCAPRGV
ncbi:transposase [Streptomyces sp. G9]|uniref:transposase n=1 Tax=Streptomyces sp. G9 TaxID=1684483 RepID=UPI003D74A762